MNRRQFLEYGTATAAAMVLGETATEPARLDVTTHRVALTAMPSVSLALVQISDLHLPYYGRHQRRIVTEAVANNPDVIVFTGDSIDRNDKLGVLDEFLSALVPSIPKFAILGNWEYWSDIDVRIIGPDVRAARGGDAGEPLDTVFRSWKVAAHRGIRRPRNRQSGCA